MNLALDYFLDLLGNKAISLEKKNYVNFLSCMSYLDTYMIILRANKKPRIKAIILSTGNK